MDDGGVSVEDEAGSDGDGAWSPWWTLGEIIGMSNSWPGTMPLCVGVMAPTSVTGSSVCEAREVGYAAIHRLEMKENESEMEVGG